VAFSRAGAERRKTDAEVRFSFANGAGKRSGGVSLGRGDVAPATKCQIGVGSPAAPNRKSVPGVKKEADRAFGNTDGFFARCGTIYLSGPTDGEDAD